MFDRQGLDRRAFLDQSTKLASAAAVLTGWSGSPVAAPISGVLPKLDDRPFALGVIGCGRQAMFDLIPNALRIPRTEVKAVCDIVRERREAARAAAGGSCVAFEDYRELLKRDDINGVIVATPQHTHCEIVLGALRNGHNVFCESTLGYTVGECKEMVRASVETGRVLQVGHHLRYLVCYVLACGTVRDEVLGDLHNVHCVWNRKSSWQRPHQDQEVDLKKWGYKRWGELANWKLYRRFSGGLMTERVVHQLDMVGALIRTRGATSDVRPVAVSGVGRTDNRDGRTVFDSIHLIYEYPDGVTATFEAITTNEFNPFGVECYEMLQGDKATLVIAHLSHYSTLLFLEPGSPKRTWMPLAPRTKFRNENLTARSYREPILLHPSEGELIGFHWQQIYDWEAAKQIFPPYELELLDFKHSVLDETCPLADGRVGLAAAVAALAGLEAMEDRLRIEITDEKYSVT